MNSFCLATYNIWNSDAGRPQRDGYILNEIGKIKPDVLCLQEVRSCAFANELAEKLRMQCYFVNYDGDQEGIAILSTFSIVEKVNWIENNAMYVQVLCEDKKIGIVNLHFPWDSAFKREQYIISIIEKLNSQESDYTFVMGDFNCSEYSDVNRMMLGECTLYGREANPCFYDLASASAQMRGVTAKDTINYRWNPRFASNTIEASKRIDRILLRNTYPNEFPRLAECDIFGTEVYPEIALAASDHYGVYARLR